MMVSFGFLSKPIDLSNNKINVLCIENHYLYRNTIRKFYDGCIDEIGIVFSENFTPIKVKNNIHFIPDIFNIDFSNSFMKKLYDDLSEYANTYLSEETAHIKSTVFLFLEKLSQCYDFDFDFKDELDITDLLKVQSFKPNNDGELLEKLLDYIFIIRKYTAVRCFILLNLHNYFSNAELEVFYKELLHQNICVILIEHKKHFESMKNEKIYIVDGDLCEIID